MRLFHYPAINNRPSRWQELEGESHRRGPESTKPEPRPQWEKSGKYEKRGIILSPQSLCPLPRARSNKSQGNHDKSIFSVHTQSQFGYLSLCSVRLKKITYKMISFGGTFLLCFFLLYLKWIFLLVKVFLEKLFGIYCEVSETFLMALEVWAGGI